MWALGALFHTDVLLVYREGPLAPKLTSALVVAIAVATCWRPTVAMLGTLAVVELIDVAVGMPQVPNHWLLSGFADLALVAAWTRARRPASLLATVRAPIMVSVAIFYCWTGFWKLNSDFFRPEISCAMFSWERLLTVFHWLPDTPSLRRVLIAATLGLELGGPLLLLVPATRGAAVVAFVGFHLLLGLDTVKVYLNFASVMFPLLILFLPDGGVARIADRVPARAQALPRIAASAYLAVALAGIAAGPASPLYMVARWALWLVYALALVVTTLVATVGAPRPTRVLPGGPSGAVWLVPVLVALNGVAPVFGLKTRTSWQMYSNIRLEAETSNHYLVPRSLDVLGVMTHPIVVVDGGGMALRDVAGSGLALPEIELRRRLAADPDASITWERDGERHVTAHVRDDPELSAPLSFPQRKLMIFRPLGDGAERRCDW